MKFRTFLKVFLAGLIVYIVGGALLRGEVSAPRFTQPLTGLLQPAPVPGEKSEDTATPPAEAAVETSPAAAPQPEVLPSAKPEKFATAMHYVVRLSNFPVADIYAGLKSLDNGQTEIHTIIKSSGIADIAGGYKTDTITLMRFNGGYFPVSYHTQFKLKGEWRTIKLAYDDAGNVVQPEYNEPPEKRWKRKEVPAALKNRALDPLTVPLAVRQRLRAMEGMGDKIKGEKFTLPLYDGRRRADLVFEVLGKSKQGDISLKFTEVPVEGYTANEIAGFKENQHTIRIDISPETFLPVHAEGDTVLGKVEVRLEKQCNTLEACMQ